MRRALLISTATVLFACSGGDDETQPARDAGTAQRDAGVTERDAGPPDSGCAPQIETTAYPVMLEEPYTYELPTPTGPYAVGTHVLHLTDESRDELATADPNDKRRFVVQLFYPTDVTDGPPAPFVDDDVATALAGFGFPANFHRSVLTRSTFDVPVASGGPFPVLIYGHGLTSYRNDNQPQLEELASHGYVIASVSFTYSSLAVVLEDGTVAADTTMIPPQGTPVEDFIAFNEELQTLIRDVWAADVTYTIDTLEMLNGPTCHFLNGTLDMQNVGLFGYSFGGATAHHVCPTDDRCVASLGLDGQLYGDIDRPSAKPAMNLMQFRPDASWDIFHAGLGAEGYTVRIEDVIHQNFSDLAHLAAAFFPNLDLVRQGISGPLGPDRHREIQFDYVGAFFDAHLRGMPSALLAGDSPYPEVLYERSNQGVTEGDLTLVANAVGPNGARLEDAQFTGVVQTATTATATSAANGIVRLAGLPKNSTVDLVIEHPQIFPVVRRVPTTENHRYMIAALNAGASVTTALLGSGPQPFDPNAGHLHLLAVRGWNRQALAVTDGAQLSMTVGDGPHYPGFNGFDASLTETGPNGSGYYVNIPPGTHTVTFSHPTLTCRLLDGGPDAPSGSAEVPVHAGRLTRLLIQCE